MDRHVSVGLFFHTQITYYAYSLCHFNKPYNYEKPCLINYYYPGRYLFKIHNKNHELRKWV